jgi:hypothetical protein
MGSLAVFQSPSCGCGFQDEFIKIFGKYTGSTPTADRQSVSKEEKRGRSGLCASPIGVYLLRRCFNLRLADPWNKRPFVYG